MFKVQPKHPLDAFDKWDKILWKKQNFPDNYVPPSFLSSLKRNSNVRPYTYLALVLAACSVTQHVSTIFLFLSIFIRLRSGALDPRVLIWISILTFPFGYTIWELLDWNRPSGDPSKSRVKAVKSSILVFLTLLATSPVLKTLSEATSSDSIWALSASLFCLNTILADYTRSRRHVLQERLTSVLSMNAAISASVVLASRLHSNVSVFALLLFSVQLFALYPILRKRMQSRLPATPRALVTSALAASSITLFMSISTTVTYLIAAVLFFVTFACPAFLVWAQRFKNEIKGPWDPAIPRGI